jgi:two-component system, OmpR family, response regulator
MEPNASILLVEDDSNLSVVLVDYLELLGYNVKLASDGEAGLQQYQQGKFDLLILDVMMPKKDGYALAKEIRLVDKQVPIVFLTARGQMEDRILGFKSGCDDYISKPFSSEELCLRIEAILKRCAANGSAETEPLDIGKYRYDPLNLKLCLGNKMQSLTPKEASLLRVLYHHKNQLITRQHAMKEVWGDDNYFIGRSMDVFISRLRKYLKDDPDVAIINVHSTGFRLEITGKN